jgi:hypothetical protein
MNKLCSIENCEDVHHARGYCQKHYCRWKNHGTTNVVLNAGENHRKWTGSDVTYGGMHQRVRKKRGKASAYQCGNADCKSQAYHWSYDHSDPDEKFEMYQGYMVSYSIDVEHYLPLCVRCHKVFDLVEGKAVADEELARLEHQLTTCDRRQRQLRLKLTKTYNDLSQLENQIRKYAETFGYPYDGIVADTIHRIAQEIYPSDLLEDVTDD